MAARLHADSLLAIDGDERFSAGNGMAQESATLPEQALAFDVLVVVANGEEGHQPRDRIVKPAIQADRGAVRGPRQGFRHAIRDALRHDPLVLAQAIDEVVARHEVEQMRPEMILEANGIFLRRTAMVSPDAAQLAPVKNASVFRHRLVVGDIGDGLQEPFGIEHHKLVRLRLRALVIETALQ